MREGNFSFTSQGKAAVCITTQLYDRRALDATSALPLNNSLTNLTYLTNTSPRIREILTIDGGLESLVRMLRGFVSSPPPPINTRQFYGLLPPRQSLKRKAPTPGEFPPFDRGAAHRFSLAFQCVVNVGVRGSESIRSRVVQAGMLQVVGAVLEAWLVSKGLPLTPSSAISVTSKENRQLRHAKYHEARQEEAEGRQRESEAVSAVQLALALQQQVAAEQSGARRVRRPPDETDGDEDMADVSGTATSSSESLLPHPSSSSELLSTDNSSVTTPIRGNTPTVEARDRSGTLIAPQHNGSVHNSVTETHIRRPSASRRGPMGIETDGEDLEADASNAQGTMPHVQAVAVVDSVGDDGIQVFGGARMDGFRMNAIDPSILNMEANDDMALGAPPGAPGAATQRVDAGTPRPRTVDTTPRAALASLADDQIGRTLPAAGPTTGIEMLRDATSNAAAQRVRLEGSPRNNIAPVDGGFRAPVGFIPETPGGSARSSSLLAPSSQQGPFKDEDVLLSLQLLAYLSKYPYVRQAFYTPRSITTSKNAQNPSSPVVASNIFSLVERFTFRPAVAESHPRLPWEIQYWAGVIMRNACRKDESRGGIRQCANMTCGKWEQYPREFAKCRRCRKAKYCGKECQSRAWAEGHRFWCSARDPEEDNAEGTRNANSSNDNLTPRRAHHHHHHHHHHSHHHHRQNSTENRATAQNSNQSSRSQSSRHSTQIPAPPTSPANDILVERAPRNMIARAHQVHRNRGTLSTTGDSITTSTSDQASAQLTMAQNLVRINSIRMAAGTGTRLPPITLGPEGGAPSRAGLSPLDTTSMASDLSPMDVDERTPRHITLSTPNPRQTPLSGAGGSRSATPLGLFSLASRVPIPPPTWVPTVTTLSNFTVTGRFGPPPSEPPPLPPSVASRVSSDRMRDSTPLSSFSEDVPMN